MPLDRIDLLVEVGAADEPSRVDRVYRRVRAVGRARQFGELARQIRFGELVALRMNGSSMLWFPRSGFRELPPDPAVQIGARAAPAGMD